MIIGRVDLFFSIRITEGKLSGVAVEISGKLETGGDDFHSFESGIVVVVGESHDEDGLNATARHVQIKNDVRGAHSEEDDQARQSSSELTGDMNMMMHNDVVVSFVL